MNLHDTARMLAVITRAYGGMTLQDGQPQLWAEWLADLDTADAMEGLKKHVQTSERIPTIADIRKQAKAIRQERATRKPAVTGAIRATDPNDSPEWGEARALLDELAAKRKAKDAAKRDPSSLAEMVATFAQRIEATASEVAE